MQSRLSATAGHSRSFPWKVLLDSLPSLSWRPNTKHELCFRNEVLVSKSIACICKSVERASASFLVMLFEPILGKSGSSMSP